MSWLRKFIFRLEPFFQRKRIEGELSKELPRAWSYAGFCLGALGRNEAAVAVLREGLSRDPDDPTMLGLLGQAYGSLGRRPEEQECYLRVLALDPSHAMAAYGMARSLQAEDKFGEALLYAKRAARLGYPEAAALARDLENRLPRE